jgi:MoaA/NifB/PqqE/SkfB family radical SAM enzyme
MPNLPPIKIPKRYNYIGVFLSLKCNLKCSYCLNLMEYDRFEMSKRNQEMSTQDWIDALNRIEARDDLPITLQGGEPTLRKDFYEIITGVNRPLDLLTNCQFDINEFINKVSTNKFRRTAPYASIRVSYHPDQMDLADTVRRVSLLHDSGYQIGVWMVELPDKQEEFLTAKKRFTEVGIDFRGKELLGEYKGKLYGTYKYPNAVGKSPKNYKACMCRTTELLIAPDGIVHRCHADLYNMRIGLKHILEERFKLDRAFRGCRMFGGCGYCDVKRKNNRFQIMGHTSVEIKNEEE